jgi:hypothetical protein
MDFVAGIKDVAELVFRSTMEVPVITLPLLFLGGLLVGWVMGH